MRMTASGVSTDRVSKTTEIFSHRWPAFEVGNGPGSSSKHTSTLLAGNYEWPFELVIPGSMAESVEGLHESHIVYKLKATVARGKLAYDLHAWKPVRVVRTLDPSALELAHAMTVENVWPNKIEYQLIIPQKAIIFGTAIDVEMRFTSLLKGLRIGQIKCLLVEEQEFRLPGLTAQSERRHKHTRDIDNWTFEMNEEEHYHDLLEDGQDGYVLKEQMPLPKKLSRYIQDVEVHGIKIRHKVKFTVALHNPDGHVSEVSTAISIPRANLTNLASCNTSCHSVYFAEYAPNFRWGSCRPDSDEYTVNRYRTTRSTTIWRTHFRPALCRYGSNGPNDTSTSLRNEYALLCSVTAWLIGESFFEPGWNRPSSWCSATCSFVI